MKKNGNGFATRNDLRKLEKKIDLRFAQVDKRFAQVDKRFAQVDKRFAQVDKKLGSIDIRLGVFKLSWDNWKQDAFTEFNSRWVNKIDPILGEIEKHREKEVIWAEQNRRADERTRRFEERLDKINQWIKEREGLEPLWAEQAKRREDEWTKQLKEMRLESKNREEKWAAEFSQTRELVERIAKKVGV